MPPKGLLNNSPLAGLPILMLTARVEDADKLKGLDIGADLGANFPRHGMLDQAQQAFNDMAASLFGSQCQ